MANIVRSHPQGLDKIRQAPKELAKLMQEYVDDAPMESDRFLTGLDLTMEAAVDLFNDFLLFVNGGIDPPLKVIDPTESKSPESEPIMIGGFVGDPL